MYKKSMYALIDCNNFYVSCERLFNPRIRNKPVVILSGNDGCVVSRSQEAKKIGVKMGEPFFKCRDLLENNKGIVISGNLVLYSDISRRVMNTLKEITDKVHIYSIDEAFLEIKDIMGNPVILARRIRKLIYKNVGIPVSVGIASTKTLCKLATSVAKSDQQKYKGVISFIGKDIKTILSKTQVQDIWGIGNKTSQKLIDHRIFTAGELVEQQEVYLKKILGSKLPLQTYYELKGISCIPFRERVTPQSILCSRSLKKEISDLETIKNIIANFVMQAYRRLYNAYSSARSISIIMNENRFKVDDYKSIISKKFDNYHRDFQLFLKTAAKLVDENYNSQKSYKRLGVILNDIQDQSNVESLLFSKDNNNKSERLFDVMEFFNNKYNKLLITPLSSNISREYSKKEFKSQRYTTNWNEILEIEI